MPFSIPHLPNFLFAALEQDIPSIFNEFDENKDQLIGVGELTSGTQKIIKKFNRRDARWFLNTYLAEDRRVIEQKPVEERTQEELADEEHAMDMIEEAYEANREAPLPSGFAPLEVTLGEFFPMFLFLLEKLR